MFYGTYQAAYKTADDYFANVEYFDYEDYYSFDTTSVFTTSITDIPYEVICGHEDVSSVLSHIDGYNWAKLRFMQEEDNRQYTIDAAYTISGNTITFTPVSHYTYDEETQRVRYIFSDKTLTYEFQFKGPYMALSKGDIGVVLMASDFFAGETINLSGYLADGPNHDIEHLSFLAKSNSSQAMLTDSSGYTHEYRTTTVKMGTDGLLTYSYIDEAGTQHTYQYVYFYCHYFGGILTDGKNNYIYKWNTQEREKYEGELTDLITFEDSEDLENIDDETIQEIIEKKYDLLKDLAKAYEDAGMNVDINETTGEITLDSTVLFDVSESAISSAGKEFLKKFIGIYTSVVFDDKYKDFVSTILVEGHTDTSGGYDMNLKLSQDRADSVKYFCLSNEGGVADNYLSLLSASLKSVGYSYDKPIYDSNGNVDMDASRRVSFRFLISLAN